MRFPSSAWVSVSCTCASDRQRNPMKQRSSAPLRGRACLRAARQCHTVEEWVVPDVEVILGCVTQRDLVGLPPFPECDRRVSGWRAGAPLIVSRSGSVSVLTRHQAERAKHQRFRGCFPLGTSEMQQCERRELRTALRSDQSGYRVSPQLARFDALAGQEAKPAAVNH